MNSPFEQGVVKDHWVDSWSRYMCETKDIKLN